jgi:hypothetical protein
MGKTRSVRVCLQRMAASWCVLTLLACEKSESVQTGPLSSVPSSGAGAARADTGEAPQPSDAGRPRVLQVADAGPQGPGPCATLEIQAQYDVATVWLLVDGSGSMLEPLSAADATPRWEALRSALVDPEEGLVKTRQSDVRWGFIAYDGPLAEDSDAGVAQNCSRIVAVDPALGNYDAVAEAFADKPFGGSTPTDRALEALLARYGKTGGGPTVVVLATDGQPNDFCSAAPAAVVENKTINLVAKLARMGGAVKVLSLAGGDAALSTYLGELAKATTAASPVLAPSTRGEVVDALRGIVEQVAGCELPIDTVSPGSECDLDVSLDGEALACNGADGWRLNEERSAVQLVGKACERYKSERRPTLRVALSCEVQERP